MRGTLADGLRHLVKRDLVVARTVKVDQRMPDHRPQPPAYRPTSAICRKLRDTFAVDHARAVKLDVNGVDNLLRVCFGLCQVPCNTLHVTAMLLVELPPRTLVTVRARER